MSGLDLLALRPCGDWLFQRPFQGSDDPFIAGAAGDLGALVDPVGHPFGETDGDLLSRRHGRDDITSGLSDIRCDSMMGMTTTTAQRYTARCRTLPDGGTETVLIDWVGNNGQVSASTKAQDDATYHALSDFFDAGVERYGSVDGFTRAMQAYDEARSVVKR